MFIRPLALLSAAAIGLAGCGVMERYHAPVTQADVPVAVVVAYSEDHPNHTIKSITQQKMFDDSVHYKFLITDAPNHEAEVVYDAEGKRVEHPM